ncbi:MAG: hybrid sensor histidine kinase/response regulator [Myxococcota bacterium]|nr:hybrid sensor histidine kinase/response regulator [Myxococcota bacterium]
MIAALAEIHNRPAGIDALARYLGARAVRIFVPHPDVPEKLVPAPGFGITLPSSRGWRSLLAQCATPGVYEAEVAFPDASTSAPALAYAYEGLALVFIDAKIAPELCECIEVAAPLLAGLLRGEAAVITARADLEVARQAAERAVTLARSLDLARHDAEQATRVKDEFLAMLGHELRNPLAPIVTALQMMRLEGVNTRSQDILERQVAHVLRLVDDLLDVSRITSGKVELRKEPTEIHAIVTRAIEMSRPLLEQRRTQLEVDVPERGLVVDGDPSRLSQVVSNLIVNAAKYSDRETRVRVFGELVLGHVRVSVEDQGIGIDPVQLSRIFDQFVQMPQANDRAHGGLGLGLAIVKSLVQLHGGTVRAYSEGRGCGSTFVLELPTCQTAPTADGTTPKAPKKRAAVPLDVLIVDDNQDAAELMGEILGAYGHNVRVANTGPEALAILANFKPRAAILDIGLPVMDGNELARRIRAEYPDVCLIAVTGYGQTSDRSRTAAAGFSDHLVKPVSIGAVTTALERLCP